LGGKYEKGEDKKVEMWRNKEKRQKFKGEIEVMGKLKLKKGKINAEETKIKQKMVREE
jgi:hypothetical protein